MYGKQGNAALIISIERQVNDMERLTGKDENGNVYRTSSEISDSDVWNKLEEYEATGLTPEEIKNDIRVHTELWEEKLKELQENLETERIYSEYWHEQALTEQKLIQNMKNGYETYKRESISDKSKLGELRIWLHDNDLDMDDILRKVNK